MCVPHPFQEDESYYHGTHYRSEDLETLFQEHGSQFLANNDRIFEADDGLIAGQVGLPVHLHLAGQMVNSVETTDARYNCQYDVEDIPHKECTEGKSTTVIVVRAKERIEVLIGRRVELFAHYKFHRGVVMKRNGGYVYCH